VVANQNFVKIIFNLQIDKVDDPNEPAYTTIFKNDDRLELYCATIEGNVSSGIRFNAIFKALFNITKESQDQLINYLISNWV
jgi:hypothetical protein